MAPHTQATTFQRVVCKGELTLNMVFYPYIYYILSLQFNRPLRNTGITFAFCSGYFSLDVEELSSKKQYLNFVISISRIYQAVVFFSFFFLCFISFLSSASDR